MPSHLTGTGEDVRTHGLWAHTAPPLASGTLTLNESVSAEVAIVGGGYTGLSTALHLRELGVSVALIEAVDVGYGASGRNVGLVNAGLWLSPRDIVAALGSVRGERLIALLSEAPREVFAIIDRYAIECEAERSGTLHCAVGARGRAELEQRHAQWQARGAPVELLGRSETAARLGTAAFSGSLLDRRAGTLQPLAYARGLASAAARMGARIYTGSAIERIERDASQWKLFAPHGTVSADWVVIATDVHATGPWSEVRGEQVALPYFNVATRPLPESVRRSILPGRQGAWDTQRVLRSLRLDRDGRLIFGSVGALHGLGTSVHRAFAVRSIRTLFPQITAVDLEYAWYGTIGITVDMLPRFHRFAPKVIGVCGYNGRGIGPATAFGRLLAAHVRGRLDDDELPLLPTPPGRAALRRVRELTYEYGALLLHYLGARSRLSTDADPER